MIQCKLFFLKKMSDWRKIHEFSGDLIGCKGKCCPSSCCTPHTAEIEGKSYEYTTTFLSKELISFFSSGSFSLSSNDLSALHNGERITIAPSDIDIQLVEIAQSAQFLVSRCLDAEDGCKLKENRPLACKFFPFGTEAAFPLASPVFGSMGRPCPEAQIIASQAKTIEQIMHIRELLGYEDNAIWEKALRSAL